MHARCEKCNGTGTVDRPYLGMKVNPDLLQQTPNSVWDGYRASGYTLQEAIAEELSYGDLPR